MSQPDFEPEWIWGDDAETTVFAQGYGLGLTVIFNFVRAQEKPPSSLANRICTSFHGIEMADEKDPFPDSSAMREALWDAIHTVWPRCNKDPQISKPNAVVNIDRDDDSSEVTWSVYHHPMFPRYVQHLADEQRRLTTGASFYPLCRFC